MSSNFELKILKEKIFNELIKNDVIFKHWIINEYLNDKETFHPEHYEKHLNSIINLTISSLKNIGLINIVEMQKGGGFSIKVYIIALILAALYGVLDYGEKQQISIAVEMIDRELNDISEDLKDSAPHTSFVLKSIMDKIGTCDYYNPVTATFESKMPTSQLLLTDKDGINKNKEIITKKMALYKSRPSNKKTVEITEVSETINCQINNIVKAIETDAMLSVNYILKDTAVIEPSIWDKFSTGFGLLANPTQTAVDVIGKAEFMGTQSSRRLSIQQSRIEELNKKYMIAITNIKQIVSNKAVVVTNLGIAKKLIYSISIAGLNAITGVNADSLALVLPNSIPTSISAVQTTVKSTAIVEVIKTLSLPISHFVMKLTESKQEKPEIEVMEGGKKKKTRKVNGKKNKKVKKNKTKKGKKSKKKVSKKGRKTIKKRR